VKEEGQGVIKKKWTGDNVKGKAGFYNWGLPFFQ